MIKIELKLSRDNVPLSEGGASGEGVVVGVQFW
jgi:hypothetical protein